MVEVAMSREFVPRTGEARFATPPTGEFPGSCPVDFNRRLRRSGGRRDNLDVPAKQFPRQPPQTQFLSTL